MVGFQIVHDEHVAAAELGQQLCLEPTNESVGVGGLNMLLRSTQPVSRTAPSRVRVVPQFIGVRSMYSVPFLTQTWPRAIDRWRPDSSRNTSFCRGIWRIFLRKVRRFA
jgi:hypothetical protein